MVNRLQWGDGRKTFCYYEFRKWIAQELKKEKGKSATLMEQVEELASENEKWESLAQSKTILLEEETKKWTE